MHAKPFTAINFSGLAITIIALALIAVFVDISVVQEYVATAGIWAPLLFIGLKILTVVVAPISGSPLYPLVGLLFGFWPGFLYVVIGDFLGYTIAFFLSRFFGRPIVMRFIAGHEEGTVSKIMKHMGTTKGIVHMCLAFLPAPELVAYAGGLSRVRYPLLIALLMPASMLVGGTLVLFGSILDIDSNHSLLISLGLPVIGLCIMLLGGVLFLKGVRKL